MGPHPFAAVRRIPPRVRFDARPPPQVVIVPPTLLQPNPIRRPETLLGERHRERHQQEVTGAVSRPQRLQRRRHDEEPAVTEADRPRRLHRARPPPPVPGPIDTPALGEHRYAIRRWWARPMGSAVTRNPRVQPANQEVSLDAQSPSETPTDEEWVMLSSRTDNVRQTIIIQPPSLDEGARTPNAGLQQTSTAIDARMKPLPPVPVVRSTAQQTNMTDVGTSLQLAFPPRQRRDSDQSRSGYRGVPSVRPPRLSFPGRVRH